MKKWHISVLFFIILLTGIAPAHAQSWYMGTSLEAVDLGQDLSDVSTGIGLALDFGLDFHNGFQLNLGIASSGHDQGGYDATYSRFSLGPRIVFDAGGVLPYLEAGFMSHHVSWDYLPYDIDGNGLYAGGGLWWPMMSGNRLGCYFKLSSWDGQDNYGNYGNVTTTVLGVSYTFVY